MLADKVDHVIGVDTHNHSHTIAVVSPAGAVIAHRRSRHTRRLPVRLPVRR
jgi:hypothetical protein